MKSFRCQLNEINDFYADCPMDKEDGVEGDECIEKYCCDSCGLPCGTKVEEAEKKLKTNFWLKLKYSSTIWDLLAWK